MGESGGRRAGTYMYLREAVKVMAVVPPTFPKTVLAATP
jgi:hypothetical protein